MQKGFSLIEMLLAGLFGSLLLTASSQALIGLIRYQTDQSELLRLTEKTTLAEMALKQTLAFSADAVIIGKAVDHYPAKTPKKTHTQYSSLGNNTSFNQFSSSDWLILLTNNDEKKYGVFHLDKKSYGYGLAYKELSTKKIKSISNTLVNQVELLRFRYLPDENTQEHYCLEKQKITINEDNKVKEVEGLNCSAIEENPARGIQFAFILATQKPIKKPGDSSFYLWGETLIPPKDGLYRQLISSTVRLSKDVIPSAASSP